MKPVVLWIGMLFLVLIGTAPVAAVEHPESLTPRQLALIEKNIANNLKECCPGVLVGTMQTLVELMEHFPQYNFRYAEIPLLYRLKNDDRPEVRISAAQALYAMNTARGKFAVSRRAIYDPSEWVAKQCQQIMHVWNGEVQTSEPLEMPIAAK